MGLDPAKGSSSRIVSMDQFRGYTIVGMVFVNFIGDFAVSHPVFSHHNTYFSYADSIMPAFHFAVGFSFRLTLLRRLATSTVGATYGHFIRRDLGLILLGIILGGVDNHFKTWQDLGAAGAWGAVAGPLKCEFWDTLAIIGVTSLWILPVMAASAATRVMFMIACSVFHLFLSHWFYFDFLWSAPNWFDAFWGATKFGGLDGGPFGCLAWAMPQIVGSLVYDAVANRRGWVVGRLAAWAMILMAAGYGLSCLSTLYNLKGGPLKPGWEVSQSPVLPRNVSLAGIDYRSLLAEPPFTPPPTNRPMNFWMMSKRATTLPFMLFATGFALGIYSLFVLMSDVGGWQVGVFRTFGQNPLAAYIIHELVSKTVQAFAPNNSPLWWVILAFAVYFGITYIFVRHLEKHGLFIRM